MRYLSLFSGIEAAAEAFLAEVDAAWEALTTAAA